MTVTSESESVPGRPGRLSASNQEIRVSDALRGSQCDSESERQTETPEARLQINHDPASDTTVTNLKAD